MSLKFDRAQSRRLNSRDPQRLSASLSLDSRRRGGMKWLFPGFGLFWRWIGIGKRVFRRRLLITPPHPTPKGTDEKSALKRIGERMLAFWQVLGLSRAGWSCSGNSPTGKKMLSINDLPEEVLVEVLLCVPCRDLIIHCRLVCSFWTDLVDLPTLWKRKCQLEGLLSNGGIRNPEDWRYFYFLFKLKKNLLRNQSAVLKYWNGGERWDLLGEHGQPLPDKKVKYVVTSYGDYKKSQLIDPKAAEQWKELIDAVQPDIVVADWCASRADGGCRYDLTVTFVSVNQKAQKQIHMKPVFIQQWNKAKWRKAHPQ